MKNFVKSIAVCFLFAATFFVPAAQAQLHDPGPRPVGTVPAVPFCPDQPSGAGDFRSKFPGAPPCVDVSQPPNGDAIGVPQGAGNIISAAGNIATFWFWALAVFETEATVPGSPKVPQTGGATIPGLGPSFNGTSCFQCHSQPAVGGSSPNNLTPNFNNTFFPGNPQVGDAPTSGQLQNVSSFIHLNGPVREARFVNAVPAATTNTAPVGAGAVAELFVIQGRPDNPQGCVIDQEPFAAQVNAHNVIFRIPIPTFGDGFVEAVPDENLASNLASEISVANNTNLFNPPLGIQGHLNHNGNDQTVTRFGWKAQNKSLLIFAGEAANVEMGVTNELFQNERTIGNGSCTPNGIPEDQVFAPPPDPDPRGITNLLATFGGGATGTAAVMSDISSSIENFAVFMWLNSAPSVCNYNSGVTNGKANCLALDASAQRGQAMFGTVGLQATTTPAPPRLGCVLCHTDILSTGPSQNSPGLDHQTFHPFSDFALHHMGGLADGVIQGDAAPDEFRTAPLWGLGQRLFFLHDGRHPNPSVNENGLLQTILDHCLPVPTGSTVPASEACGTVNRFNALPDVTPAGTTTPSKQDVLNFLRSL
ncbi:MAG TPA: di-heme oxidoredictase family protein [Candidatus Angelobacter sp.]|jgi:hypothetical protein|nr:di-heme oxidoredictase family protein [Candidatus Angelobacter sp.]